MNPAYSPDGKYLAWRSQERAGYESDKFRLALYDREKKTVRDLLPKLDDWINEFAWASNSKIIHLICGYQGATNLESFKLNGTPDFFGMAIEKSISEGFDVEEWSDLHPLQNENSILVAGMTVRHPSEVFILEDATEDTGGTYYDKKRKMNVFVFENKTEIAIRF